MLQKILDTGEASSVI